MEQSRKPPLFLCSKQIARPYPSDHPTSLSPSFATVVSPCSLATYFHHTPTNANIRIPTLPSSPFTTSDSSPNPPLQNITATPLHPLCLPLPLPPPFFPPPTFGTISHTVSATQNAHSSTLPYHATTSFPPLPPPSRTPPARSTGEILPGTLHGSSIGTRVFGMDGWRTYSTSCSKGSQPRDLKDVAAVMPWGFRVR